MEEWNPDERRIDLKKFAQKCADGNAEMATVRFGLKFETPLHEDKFCSSLTRQVDELFYSVAHEYLQYYGGSSSPFIGPSKECSKHDFLKTKEFYYGEQRLYPKHGDTVFFDSRKLRKGFYKYANENCTMPECLELKSRLKGTENRIRAECGTDEKVFDYVEIHQIDEKCISWAYYYLDSFFNNHKKKPEAKNQIRYETPCFPDGIPALYFGTTRVDIKNGGKFAFNRKEIRSIL